MEYDTPKTLLEIDRVDVIDLKGIRWGDEDFWDKVRAASATSVQSEQAFEIATLWRSLPAGKQARCHLPPFAFRFFAGSTVVQEASVCWRCNDIHGSHEGRKLFLEFDGNSRTARKLLELVEFLTGVEVDE